VRGSTKRLGHGVSAITGDRGQHDAFRFTEIVVDEPMNIRAKAAIRKAAGRAGASSMSTWSRMLLLREVKATDE
jgi:hypothetical protein